MVHIHFCKNFTTNKPLPLLTLCTYTNYNSKGVFAYLTLAEAASSTNQYNCPCAAGRTLDAGRECLAGSSMISARISCLAPPVATNATLLAWLITGYVSVILLGGGFGEPSKGATHRSSSANNGWSGNNEAVCPSGPRPSKIRSKTGNRAESFDANPRISCFSYESASSSRSSSKEASM